MKNYITAVAFFSLLGVSGVNAQNTDTIPGRMVLGGSVDNVTTERMNKGLLTNSLDALSGQAVGVSVSSGADRMAMLSSVRVRGTTSLTGGNDPLVVIDGVYSDLSTLSNIFPADIESFKILKNAAETAPFGSRGASGVILVTTKKGKTSKFQISYDGSLGFESVYKNLKMLDRNGYLSNAEARGYDYLDGGYNTDFLKVPVRTGVVQNNHVAFSGGTEASNYRASIGYQIHNTVIKVNSYRNFVAKIDLHQKAFDDRLIIDLGVLGSTQKNKYIFDDWKLFYSAASMNPTLSDQQKEGGGWVKNANASQIGNPAALMRQKDDEKSINVSTHISLDFLLLKRAAEQLNFRAFGALSYTSDENARFLPTWDWAQGEAYRQERKTNNIIVNGLLKWHKQFSRWHDLNLIALGEYQRTTKSGFWTTVKGFTTNELGYDNLGAASTIPYGGTGSDYDRPSLASFLVGGDYTLYGKYTFKASLRADGSSMFGKNNRWGYFPSVSAEWDVKKEDYLIGVDKISMLKLRTGYGLSGNLGGIESYNSLRLLKPAGRVTWNEEQRVIFSSLSNVNPDLKWETRSTFNIGTDIGLLDNRLVLTAEYYYSKTRDMLYEYDVPVPPYPYSKWIANLGKMSNQGLEIGVGVTPLQTRDMELDINVNMAFQKNKLISLSGVYKGTQMTASDITPIGGLDGAGFHGGDNNIVYQIVGQPLGVFYLPHCTGLVENADGTYSYGIADLDHNGIENIEDGGDRYIAGQAMPKMMLGSNISFRYKDFDVSLQMNGAFGHKIYNGTSLTYMNMASFPDYNVMRGAPEKNISDQTVTDYWLKSGDYFNFDYLTIGWNVPLRNTKYISGLRVSCSVNNIGTITSYNGLTPMINSSVVNPTLGIDDKCCYPLYRSYSVAVSLKF